MFELASSDVRFLEIFSVTTFLVSALYVFTVTRGIVWVAVVLSVLTNLSIAAGAFRGKMEGIEGVFCAVILAAALLTYLFLLRFLSPRRKNS